MLKKYLYILLIFAVSIVAGCTHDNVEYVDFTGDTGFSVYAVVTTDLDENIPYFPMPEGGMPLAEDANNTPALLRTTSIGGTTFAKQFLDATNYNAVHQISGTYISVDQNGDPIRLSGKIMLPAKGDIKNVIVVSHYTIGAAYEAPSESFQLEGVLVPMGYALVFADYIGFGATIDHVHPYLCANLTAQNVVDLLEVAVPYLKKIGRAPLSDEIYLMGYSQGGATTLAVQRLLETDKRYNGKYHIRRNFAGAGPYDIAATYDNAVDMDKIGIPCAIPMIIQGMNTGENLGLDYSEFFKDDLLAHFDEWINSKKYTVAEIATLMAATRLSDFMTDEARQKRNSTTSVLYRAMLHNSVVSTWGWQPQAPVYMFHSQDDDTVPFLNSQRAKAEFSDCNIEFNFGHYGSHQMGCIRFIGCVKELLKLEE